MIVTAGYCRKNRIPYLGICLGMQVSVIEFARNVSGMKDADSREFNENSPYKVIDFLPDQYEGINKGGTLRLGAYPCLLQENTLIRELYGRDEISERHRHRYEFNNEFRQRLSDDGLILSGLSPDKYIVETVELADHPYFIGVQYHPEFKSRPNKPHPLFVGLINAAKKQGEK